MLGYDLYTLTICWDFKEVIASGIPGTMSRNLVLVDI